MEADIKLYDRVDSTNTVLEKLAEEGAQEGVCVVSLFQSKGQGRSGRTFFSPEGGNLYMSLLLRPKEQSVTGMITVMSAVAVLDAINEEFNIKAGIKWVNDIMLGGKKVCGMVAKAAHYGTDDMYVVLGIGINIYENDDVPEDIAGIYGTVTGRKCDLSTDDQRHLAKRLAENIIGRFAAYYEADDPHKAIEPYRAGCIAIGRRVCYMAGDAKMYGVIKGIDDNGGIILDTGDKTVTYTDGEIRLSYDDMNLA